MTTPYRRFVAEGQPDGTHLSTANSASGSGDPLTVATRGTGANLNYSNNWAFDGSQSIRIDGTSGTSTLFGWNDLNDMSLAFFLAMKFDIGDLPSVASFREADFRNATGTAMRVCLTAANKVQLQDTNGTAMGTAPNALLDGHAYVISGSVTISATAAHVTFDYYDETDLTTSLWHFSTNTANTGTTAITTAVAGACVNTTWIGTQWVDGFAIRGGTTSVMPVPVAVNSVGTLANSSAGSIAVPYPASVGAGDVILMFLQSDAGASGYPTTPSGWTMVTEEQAMPPSPGLVMLQKNVRATGSESGTVAVTASSDWAGVMVSISNVRPAGNPWNTLSPGDNAVAGVTSFSTVAISPDASAASGRRTIMAVAALSGVHSTETLNGNLTNATLTEIFDSSGMVIVTAQGDGGTSAYVTFTPASTNGYEYVIFDLVEALPFAAATDSASDAAAATDATTRSFRPVLTTADTAAATDAASRAAQTQSRTASDTAAATDTPTGHVHRFASTSDTAHAADALTRGLKASARGVSDAAGAIDTTSSPFDDVITIVDNIAITDLDLQQTIEYVIPAGESAAAVDSASSSFVPSLAIQSRMAVDSASAADAPFGASAAAPMTRSAADTVPSLDAAMATFGRARVVQDTAQASDNLTAGSSEHISALDSAPALESATAPALHPRVVADRAPGLDDLVRSTGKLRVVGEAAPGGEILSGATIKMGLGVDAARATDTANSAPGSHIGAIDSAHATDSVGSHEILGRTGAETAHATDVAAGSHLQSLARSAADTSHATDVASRPAQTVSRTTSNGAPGLDFAGPVHTQAVSAADLASAADDAARFALKQLLGADVAAATDTLSSGTHVFARQVTDTAPAIDEHGDQIVILLGTMTLAEPMYRFALAERMSSLSVGER